MLISSDLGLNLSIYLLISFLTFFPFFLFFSLVSLFLPIKRAKYYLNIYPFQKVLGHSLSFIKLTFIIIIMSCCKHG